MANAWKIASDNFRTDDGSLPTVEFADLRAGSTSAIYKYIAGNGRCETESPTLWDNILQADVPLLSVQDPCRLVQEGRADSFHCCFAGITVNCVEIPSLGIFVFQDSMELDFRMGTDWNETNVDSFFWLIAHLKALAPEAKIRSAETEGLVNERSFLAALSLYIPQAGETEY